MSCTCVSNPQIECIVHPDGSAMTVEEFKAALPAQVKKSVNQAVIDKVNQVLSDPEMYETYRENLLSYGKVMAEGKFKLPNYIDAVKYVSHKLRGLTNKAAFEVTFPAKVQEWTAQGVKASDQASYITAYNKSKLVNLIYAQSIIPTWVLNQDLYQQALNVQAELMVSAKSEMVRTTAANSVLQQLKPPEATKLELDISVKEDSAIAQLRRTTLELVAQQRQLIQAGVSTVKEIAHSQVVMDADYVEVPSE